MSRHVSSVYLHRMDGGAFYLQEKHFDEIFVTIGGGLKMLDLLEELFVAVFLLVYPNS